MLMCAMPEECQACQERSEGGMQAPPPTVPIPRKVKTMWLLTLEWSQLDWKMKE